MYIIYILLIILHFFLHTNLHTKHEFTRYCVNLSLTFLLYQLHHSRMCSASATAAALALLPDPVFACDYLDLCVYSFSRDDDDADDDDAAAMALALLPRL